MSPIWGAGVDVIVGVDVSVAVGVAVNVGCLVAVGASAVNVLAAAASFVAQTLVGSVVGSVFEPPVQPDAIRAQMAARSRNLLVTLDLLWAYALIVKRLFGRLATKRPRICSGPRRDQPHSVLPIVILKCYLTSLMCANDFSLSSFQFKIFH